MSKEISHPYQSIPIVNKEKIKGIKKEAISPVQFLIIFTQMRSLAFSFRIFCRTGTESKKSTDSVMMAGVLSV